MIPELRVCIAQAVWTVTSDLRFRIDRVRFIQLLLNELFRKTDFVGLEVT